MEKQELQKMSHSLQQLLQAEEGYDWQAMPGSPEWEAERAEAREMIEVIKKLQKK